MTFLSPWSALLAAAAAIPLLLLLYFLRLRRQRLRIASTLLWQKSFEDLQANALFQKLRWSALLALQLLLLTALLLAMAQPAIRGNLGVSPRTILIIDRSASMQSTTLDQSDEIATRLDEAKRIAREMVDAMTRSADAQQMMIIAMGSTPQIITTYESNRRSLHEAIDSIQPTDEQADLAAALQLAGAYTGSARDGEDVADRAPEVVLVSDGCIGSSSSGGANPYRLASGRFRFVPVIGAAADESATSGEVNNVGITLFSVSRAFDDPAAVRVFVRLINAGTQPIECVVTLLIDDAPAASIRRTIPPASEAAPGEDSFTHVLELAGGATLTARHNHADDLPADDVAWLVLPEPQLPRIVLVHPDDSETDPFLHDLLRAVETRDLRVMPLTTFSSLNQQQLDAGELFDLIVFDRVSVSRLPNVSTLTFGANPFNPQARDAESNTDATDPNRQSTGQRILSWDRQHPLMRHVSLDSIVFSGLGGFDASSDITPLAFGRHGPVMVEFRRRGVRHAAIGFELLKSNWPLHVSSAIFIQNAIDYFTLAQLGATGLAHRAGEAISVRAQSNAQQLNVRGPLSATVEVDAGGIVTLPPLRRAGLYRVENATPPFDQVAVNVMSDAESDIRPRSTVAVNAETAVVQGERAAGAIPLWPYLVGVAFALLVVEWIAYCRKSR